VFLPSSGEDRSLPPTTVTVETGDHHEVDYGRHLRDSGLRPVNFRFLTIAVATLVTMLGIVHGLHEYQLRRMGSHLLKQAEEASAAGQTKPFVTFAVTCLLDRTTAKPAKNWLLP